MIMNASKKLALSSIVNSGLNLTKYPLQDLHSLASLKILEKARHDLKKTGCATFPNFITEESLAGCVDECQARLDLAHVTNNKHNAYQLSLPDPLFETDKYKTIPHVRNNMMNTKVASIAFDQLDPEGNIVKLYQWEGLTDFIASIIGKKEIHRVCDPLGACSINIFKPDWYHAWHFDESEYTITLCFQQPDNPLDPKNDGGGHFEFSTPLRKDQNEMAYPQVASIINNKSDFEVHPKDDDIPMPSITTANFQPGTLQIFAGRYSLHRVTNISPNSTKDRMVAVMCFSDQENKKNSPEVQQMFWGRTV